MDAISILGGEGRGRDKAIPSESKTTIAIEKFGKSCQKPECRGSIHPFLVPTEPLCIV